MNRWMLKRLALPILLLIAFIAVSFLVPVINPDYDEVVDYLSDENGRVIAAPPFTPDEMPPLGSDKLGRNFLLLLLVGAKYTIFAALAIALLRMVLGFFFAVLYTFLPAFLGRFIKGLGESFQYIPLAIIVFALLVPLEGAFHSEVLPSNRYFVIQVVAIAAVTIPSLGIYLGEEMKLFMKSEFIQVSRTMGAGRFHLIKQHLLPQFRRHSIVLFSEQVSQTLALLIQLGILHMCLGGLKIANFGIIESIPVYFSETNEWAATIAINIQQIFLRPMLVVVPLTLFAILILCVNMMSSTLRRSLIEGEGGKVKKKAEEKHHERTVAVSKDLFTLKQ
ncbi:ABC transporter permease subunit [Rossellomorea vietnamensis]|uniref:ABC transporter permease subunit n=1 Tax=Rossellomorea vietnamensis TaxID=218284 RepID=UPI001E6423E5|nr:ABC transporter permease subunit [Rossellomorea vietnamensis]MCC5801080.1 ABC transporter permease subunit [Rossellomorea vietnamensis]